MLEFYDYDVGSLVQWERSGKMHTIIWRGVSRARVAAAGGLEAASRCAG
jgi:hypothetical protein